MGQRDWWQDLFPQPSNHRDTGVIPGNDDLGLGYWVDFQPLPWRQFQRG